MRRPRKIIDLCSTGNIDQCPVLGFQGFATPVQVTISCDFPLHECHSLMLPCHLNDPDSALWPQKI